MNGVKVTYELTVSTASKVIKVESLLQFVESLTEGFHEDFADSLWAEFGGYQVMRARHHGVWITTTRGQKENL